MDNIFSDSNVMASYLCDIRPGASLFSVIKIRWSLTEGQDWQMVETQTA